MRRPVSRVERVEQNGERLLEAARRVFLAKGYERASLDAIADEAGFSKGVVYSQFDSKADLFLALLERRIEERAAENRRIVATTAGSKSVASLIEAAQRAFEQEPAWTLLVVEFRVHAARDAKLRRRYAKAHARTVAQLSDFLADLHRDAGFEPAHPPRAMAVAILAFGVGIELERVNDPAALPYATIEDMILRALGLRRNA